MIGGNKSLWSLAIDLNHYSYESQQLAPALLLAIARHRSLTKLTWYIPDDLDTRTFMKCLLHVCHTSIQEFHLATKRNVATYGYRFNTCPAFTREDFNYDQNLIERRSEHETLLQRLKVPMDQLKDPFRLKSLWLSTKSGEDILPVLRNCPQLEDVRIELSDTVISGQIPQVLASHCPLLRGVDLRTAWRAGDAVRRAIELRQFSQLQRVYIPFTDYKDVRFLIRGLERSSRMSLEELCMPKTELISPTFVLFLLTTFPHLKEIDFGTVKIFIFDTTGCSATSTTAARTGTAQGALHLQSRKDLESEDAISEDWDSWQGYRPLQNMDYWWSQWTLAKKSMKRVQVAYEGSNQKRELRPIHMKYMYPIRHFVSRDEAEAYADCTGPWADGRRSWKVEDAGRALHSGNQQPVQETMMSKIVTLFTGWWR